LGPNLVDGDWLWGDGSVESITRTIIDGVPKPKQYRNAMPALGGAPLTHEQVAAVAAYLWDAGHRKSTLPSEIRIPGARVFPESLTSTSDGTILIGSIGTGSVFRASPAATSAEVWLTLGSADNQAVLGVLADERSKTLWACVSALSPPTDNAKSSRLEAVDLHSGEVKARYALPTAASFCNDIAVAADGTVYVTDTNNMEILRLDTRAARLAVWAGAGAFGPKGGVLDGIAVVQNRVIVNTYATHKLFAVDINTDGSAGAITELKLNRPIHAPDGMRPFGVNSLLLVESGAPGALSRVDLTDKAANVITLKEGFPDGAVAVTVVKDTAYVLEGQLDALFSKANPKPTPAPFRATAASLTRP
jgi:streptogramin lyase